MEKEYENKEIEEKVEEVNEEAEALSDNSVETLALEKEEAKAEEGGEIKSAQPEEKEEPAEEGEAASVENAAAEQPAQGGSEEPKKAEKKKIAVIIIAVLVVVGLAIGGVVIAKKSGKTPKQQSATLADGSPAPDSPEGMKEAHSEAAEVITGEQATEKAEIKNAEAIELIMSYSDEELGLKKEDYTFMIAQQAYVIDSKEYVQVIAAEKKENKDGTFSITPHGKFYISFDGKTVLKENMDKPGEYEKI